MSSEEDRWMKNTISDVSLLYRDKLIGICTTYVDHTLHVETEEYSNLCERTEKGLNVRKKNGICYNFLECK